MSNLRVGGSTKPQILAKNLMVTSCHQNVTTNIDFAYIKSEIMSIFCRIINISQKFFTSIGLSIW